MSVPDLASNVRRDVGAISFAHAEMLKGSELASDSWLDPSIFRS
jgi:hypothetical protein